MLDIATAGFALGPPLADNGRTRRAVAGGSLRALRGRWLGVRVSPGAALAEVALRVEADPTRWPSVEVPLDPDGQTWIYVGEHTRELCLVGPEHVLGALEWRGAQVSSALPTGAHAAPAMRTTELLEREGVRELRQLAFTDDERWPLEATGSDPQLRFAPLTVSGRVSVSTHIEVEDAAPARPVAYWAGRRGYRPQATIPLSQRARGEARWHAVLPPLRRGQRWRLDPLDRPGRFRIRELSVQLAESRLGVPLRGLGLALDLLGRARPRRSIRDLRPIKDLMLLDRVRRRYAATAADPQFRVAGQLAAGFYMLELELELPQARARAQIYADTGQGYRDEQSWTLPIKSERLTKRLLWLKKPAHLRLDPTTQPGEITLRYFSLSRVPKRFAKSRMKKKLRAAGAEPQQDRLAELWQAYCNLFEASSEGGLSYPEWIERVERRALPSAAEQRRQAEGFAQRPTISILTPTYDTPLPLLRACAQSVLDQSYPDWEWCVADDASPEPHVRRFLEELAAREPRVRLVLRETNGHIAAATNSALEVASGDFVALLDHDDTLAPHALFSVVEALQKQPSAQIVYSDEDKLDAEGSRCDPFFKPSYSPDLLLSQNYVSHLGVYRRRLVGEVGGFRKGFEGSQDYDLLLRCVARLEDPNQIVHVPRVLYHWRKTEGSTAAVHEDKPYATLAAERALQEHAKALGNGARVSVLGPGLYRHQWPLPDPAPLVSLIIPTRDSADLMRVCIDSILRVTTYPNLEILVVDNQSSQAESLAYLAGLPAASGGVARVLRYDAPFNFSAINNFAARQAQGSVLGLINNDIEVISPAWLTELVSQALRPDIGCVGAKLYYPDDTIQHAGVVLGIGGVAGHSHKYFPRDADGYFSRLRIAHDVSAVTGAALVVEKRIFDQVDGLDESLAVAFNDIDFCLRVKRAGYRNLFTPFAELYHHESKSRGSETTPEKRARFAAECQLMRDRWGALLDDDPCYSPHLTLTREDYSLTLRG